MSTLPPRSSREEGRAPDKQRYPMYICVLTHQRSAVSVLCAAGGEARAAPAPLDVSGSEGGRGAAALALPRPQEPRPDQGEEEQEGEQGGHAHTGDTGGHVAADRPDISHLQQKPFQNDEVLTDTRTCS